MYVAKHFEIPDDHLTELLSRVRAGNLVTVHESGPQASFVPFHLETRETGQVLVTHLMRINPQAVEPVTGPALVIIDVDDAYVSPAWYATNKDLPNVPTWDYITIHVTGEVRFTADPGAALEAARELTARMEPPEVLEAVGEEKLRKMARAIVRAEVSVEKIQGKAKASQNRHPDDVRSLLAHLESEGETELVKYLREVALPHATKRFGMIQDLRTGRRLPTSAAGQKAPRADETLSPDIGGPTQEPSTSS